MPRICSVPGCKGKGGFVFPADKTQRQRWIEALNISHLSHKTIEKCTVCSRHFTKNDYVSTGENFYTGSPVVRKRLKLTAVPSVDLVLNLDNEIENEDPDQSCSSATASLQDHDYNFKVIATEDSDPVIMKDEITLGSDESLQVLESNVISIELNDENINKILEMYNLEDDKLSYLQSGEGLGEQTIIVKLDGPISQEAIFQNLEAMEIDATDTDVKSGFENSPKIEKIKTQSGGRVCCIKGCPNRFRKNSNTVKYYNFPTDKFVWRNERRKQWIEAVIKHNNLSSDWQPKKYKTICSAHFVGGKKSEHPMHPGYNPTIFPVDDTIEQADGTVVERFDTCIQEPQNELQVFKSLPDESTLPQIKIDKAEITSSIVSHEIFKRIAKPKFVKLKNFSGIKKITKDFQCQVDFLNSRPLNNIRTNCMDYTRKLENNLNCIGVQVYLQKEPSAKSKVIKNIIVRSTGRDIVKNTNTVIEKSKNLISLEKNLLEEINFSGITSINSENDLKCMCGVSFEVFAELSRNLQKKSEMNLSNANRLLIFLMKLKLGNNNAALSVLFNQTQEVLSQTFDETLKDLVDFFRNKVCWPSKEAIDNTIPEVFKNTYSNCRAIVEYMEIPMEVPDNPSEELILYSIYKNCFSFRLFFACAPSGFIIYKSKCYYGTQNELDIMRDCEFFGMIEAGDVILADKEFPSVRTMLDYKKAFLKVPPLVQNVQPTSVHIHIKQCINRVKLFKILTGVPVELFSKIDDIIYVCCSIINLQIPLNETK